jgi:HK97 gp10 family phage protein
VAFETTIEGADEIKRKLRQLPERIARNAMRRALRKGANVIRDAARSGAKRVDDPESSNQIWKNVVTQGGGRKMEKQMGGPVMRVGVMGGAKSKKAGTGSGKANPGGDTWYWRLLEFGTSKMRAQPFLRPAASEKAGAAIDATVNAMRTEIDKELAKL